LPSFSVGDIAENGGVADKHIRETLAAATRSRTARTWPPPRAPTSTRRPWARAC